MTAISGNLALPLKAVKRASPQSKAAEAHLQVRYSLPTHQWKSQLLSTKC